MEQPAEAGPGSGGCSREYIRDDTLVQHQQRGDCLPPDDTVTEGAEHGWPRKTGGVGNPAVGKAH